MYNSTNINIYPYVHIYRTYGRSSPIGNDLGFSISPIGEADLWIRKYICICMLIYIETYAFSSPIGGCILSISSRMGEVDL